MAERGALPEGSALVGSAITLGIGWVVAVRLLWTTVIYESWEYNDGQLLLAVLLVVCLLVAYLLPRVLSLTASSEAPERALPG
jgi:hypothetical protein